MTLKTSRLFRADETDMMNVGENFRKACSDSNSGVRTAGWGLSQCRHLWTLFFYG